jgi:hypothetical protein
MIGEKCGEIPGRAGETLGFVRGDLDSLAKPVLVRVREASG